MAAKYLAAAAKISPSPTRYFNLGLTYQKLGSRAKALQAYREALKLKPGWPEAEVKLRSFKD